MSLLEQVLAADRGSGHPAQAHSCMHVVEMTAETRLSGARVFVLHTGETDDPEPLYESAVAYVETNPLLALARSYEVPANYDEYQVSATERVDESAYPESFDLTIIDPE